MTDIELAKEIAHRAHDGQTRRNGEPYINHVTRVVLQLEMKGVSDDILAIAWLHDVVEDSMITLSTLYELFPAQIPETVARLTRTGEPYSKYIDRIKTDPIATEVKLADLADNFRDNDNPTQIERYTKAILTLTS